MPPASRARGQALEEEGERHAATDDGDEGEAGPLPTLHATSWRSRARHKREGEQQGARDGVLRRRVHGRVSELLDGTSVDVDRDAADQCRDESEPDAACTRAHGPPPWKSTISTGMPRWSRRRSPGLAAGTN